jgi:uncharacterized protein (DUF305 family)
MIALKSRTLAALAVSGLVLAACGGGDDGSSSASGNDIDRAFAADMVGHHKAAVDMAEMADTRAGHREIRVLAANIKRTQNAEIDELRRLQAEVGAHSGGEHGSGDHGGMSALGLTAEQMGMDHDLMAMRHARPFDRDFIDAMIPHHQGAIRMAKVQLAKGSSSELRELAQRVIDAQTKEIDDMRQWRRDWYGS